MTRGVRIGRGGSIGLVVGGVAALMLLVPVASATTIVAPFPGAVPAVFTLLQSGGCGTGKLVKAPTWSATSGGGGWSNSGSARSCAHSAGSVGMDSFAVSEGEIDVGVPVKLTSGAHTIVVNWSITAAGAQTFHLGAPCRAPPSNPTGTSSSTCDVTAEAFLFGGAELEDTTNGTVFGAANVWSGLFNESFQVNSTSCSFGVCTSSNSSFGLPGGGFSGTSLVSFYINATLNGHHSFVVHTFVFGGAFLDLFGYPASSASASLNAASSGNGVVLTAVQIV